MPEAGAGAQGDGRGAARGGSESKAASMAVSKRRWDLLRAALLNKEVDLSEFSDVTTKGRLADLGLIRKERSKYGRAGRRRRPTLASSRRGLAHPAAAYRDRDRVLTCNRARGPRLPNY